MHQKCPICRQASRRLFCKNTYWIRACKVCNHRFAEIEVSSTHTKQVYSDQYFQEGGAGYQNYLSEAKLLRQHGRRYGQILSRYTQPGTVLDVGAAAGFILKGLVDCGWQGKGLEPNCRMAGYARTQLGLRIETGTLEEFNKEEYYDLISMVQVVAHFFDLQQALQIANRLTKPGGFWLIETWNRHSLMARVLGKYWHEYSPPSVLHWFSPSGIGQIAAQYGFTEIARGRPAKWLNGIHAKSLLRYNLRGIPGKKLAYKMLNLIPDELVIPYPAEDLFWILLCKR